MGIDIFKGCEAPISALCAHREPHLGRCYRGSNIALLTLCLTSFCTNFPTANRDADKNQLVALTANKMSIESQRSSFSEAESTTQQSLGPTTSFCPVLSRQICTSTPDFKKKVEPRFQKTWRLRVRAGHGPHGLNSAAVRLEGAVHHLDSALKKRGG